MFCSNVVGGESSQSTYDNGMAGRKIDFVSYNYCTGPLGWLTLPELGK
jgi:carboxylesterase 2